MNTPTPIPSVDKPGDREAIQNATRRAERRATADPVVDPAKVRFALADARDTEHFRALLLAEGIEAEFDRRGQEQNVYGWRLRRQGAQEWLKASTLARDLSWPKIAHRLKTDRNTEKAQEQDRTNKEVQDADDRADDRAHAKEQDRRPAMIRSSLQARSKVDLDLPKTTKNIVQTDIGPVSKVMLLVGMAALKLSVAAIEALLNFIRWLLKKFGLMLTPAAPGSEQGKTALPFEPRFIDVLSRIIPEPAPPTAIENAESELMQVVESIEKNDPGLLPRGQGRDELVAALVTNSLPFSIPPSIPPAGAKTVEIQATAEIKQDGLDELFSAPKSSLEVELNGLIDDALAALDRAVKELEGAEEEATNALVEANEVLEAKQKLAAAAKKLKAREDAHWAEKAEAPALLRFAFPSIKSFCAKEITAVEAAEAAVSATVRKHRPLVPEHLAAALKQARIGSVRAAENAVAEQKKLLKTLENGDAELFKVAKSRVNSFAAQAGLLGHVMNANQAQITLKSGRGVITSIAEKRIEIETVARLTVQNALDAASQKYIPRNTALEDDAPGR